MTRQTVRQNRGFLFRLLKVAVQAPAHVHLDDGPRRVHLTHIAVTPFAVEPCAHVRLVAEVNEIGLCIDPDPGDRFLSLPVASHFLDYLSVAITSWHPMHFCTEGMPATGARRALEWQKRHSTPASL